MHEQTGEPTTVTARGAAAVDDQLIRVQRAYDVTACSQQQAVNQFP